MALRRAEDVQRQARALGDPTRHGIFRYVDAATDPVGVAELTDHFGLNHNAIRQHLAKLCDAGLLLEELAPPSGPGRRRLQYRSVPGAAARWGGESPYEDLALLLLEVLRTGRTPWEVGADAGRRLAAGGRPDTDPTDALEALVDRQGFHPRRVERGTTVELVLERCPYEAAASADPATVCALHRGLADGMAHALPGGIEVTNLVARDPRRAGCRLQTVRTEGTTTDV